MSVLVTGSGFDPNSLAQYFNSPSNSWTLSPSGFCTWSTSQVNGSLGGVPVTVTVVLSIAQPAGTQAAIYNLTYTAVAGQGTINDTLLYISYQLVLQSNIHDCCQTVSLGEIGFDGVSALYPGAPQIVTATPVCVSGSGSGATGPGRITDCCPGTTIPSVLHVTFKNVLGCACIDGLTATITNPFTAPTTPWINTNVSDPCPSFLGNPMAIIMNCIGQGPNGFEMGISCDGEQNWLTGAAQAGSTCNPLILNFSFTVQPGAINPCCPQGSLFSVTVTT